MRPDDNTIDGQLQAIDDAIANCFRRLESLDRDFHEIAAPSAVAVNHYRDDRQRIEKQRDQAISKAITNIERLSENIDFTQPELGELEKKYINMKHGFPRELRFGRYQVESSWTRDFYVPRMLPFPLEKPVRIQKDSELPFIHQLLLRLNYALPVDKQEYYFFDPRGLGKSVQNFNRMLTSERLVPQQKIMMNTQELKDALKHIELYIRDLYTHTFNAGCGDNWDEYNRYWYERNERRKMLPYRVFVFMDVPLEMDQDCFRMFRNLLEHNGRCGILVLFSCDESICESNDNRIKSNMEQELLQILPKKSVHPAECFSPANCQYLKLSSADEAMPSVAELRRMMDDVCEAAKTDLGSMFSFSEMLSEAYLFSRISDTGLEVPIGYDTSGGSRVDLRIDDRTPHYLIGGTTGSGKSNLLHNLIVSTCWHYSPDDVRVYLLDFKEGVEFQQYAHPAPNSLPHAVLVATEADTEYGVTVLQHLDEELSRRAQLFKAQGCRDYRAYRGKSSENHLPRILVIIDEFQVLFDSEQKLRTMETMTRLAKQGRSAGVHLVLATQSLKGISDFTTIATQFSGRIALKCAAEDSKLLLGGVTSSNEAASELEIPFAIMNTSQGSLAGNLKFAVPEAKTIDIGQKLQEIFRKAHTMMDQYSPTKIFSGQKFPNFPDDSAYFAPKLRLTLGTMLAYEESVLHFDFADRYENNVLICGHSQKIKAGLLLSILLSADLSAGCDEIAYVGEDEEQIVDQYRNRAKKQIAVFSDAAAFAKAYETSWQDKKTLVIFDDRDFIREAGFPSSLSSYARETDPSKIAMKAFWENGNAKGSHFVAFFGSGARIKTVGVRISDFAYRIAYEANEDEMNLLLGAAYGRAPSNRRDRAFLIVNSELKAVFRPFLSPKWGQ